LNDHGVGDEIEDVGALNAFRENFHGDNIGYCVRQVL